MNNQKVFFVCCRNKLVDFFLKFITIGCQYILQYIAKHFKGKSVASQVNADSVNGVYVYLLSFTSINDICSFLINFFFCCFTRILKYQKT